METLARRSITRYGVAAVAILLATVLRLLLDSELGDQQPLAFYLCAVAFVTWFGGLGPAVFALVAGLLVGDWLFVDPRFTLLARDLPGWIVSWVYLASGLFIIYFSRATHAAYHQATIRATEFLNRQLQQRVAELETLLDLVPVGVLIAEDAHCQRMRPNRAMAQLVNVTPETNFSLTAEGNKLPWRLYRQGKELTPEERPLRRSAKMGVEIHQEECEYVFEDGRKLSVEIYATPLFDDEHKPRGCIEVVIDRTQQKAEQERLARSENRYRSLVTATSAVVWLSDEIGQATVPQEPWEAFTGQTWEDYRGFGWLNAFHPEDRGRVMAAWDRAKETGTFYEAKARLWHKESQEYRYVRDLGAPIQDASGRIIEWVGTCTDITEQVALQESLQQRAEQLAEGDRKKDEFLAMLGHELRNPLAGIANGIQVLKMVRPDSQDSIEMREVIERQAGHMARLIDDLLDVSRISRGKIQLRRKRLDLAQLVRNSFENYRIQMEEHGLSVVLNLPDDPLWIEADPTRLSQVMGNLLNNAMKFTDAGGQVAVAVAADRETGTARVTVKDTGIGIEPHLLKRLFEPFSQADSSLDRTRGGLGLGLALVKGLVEMHGGNVMACSPGLGQGTEIRVRLPLAGEEVKAQPPITEHLAPVRSHRVLLIDDRRDAILPLKKMLKLLGQEVEVADSGKSGLAKAWEFRPEVVLCDIGLPDLDGYEVAQTMRADPTLRSAYLVAVTGYGQEEDRRRAVESGFDYHVTKPVAKDQLEHLLAEFPRIEMLSDASR